MLSELNVVGKVVHESGAPVSVSIERGQRGGYGWTIQIRGCDENAILSLIAAIDARLRTSYLIKEEV